MTIYVPMYRTDVMEVLHRLISGKLRLLEAEARLESTA